MKQEQNILKLNLGPKGDVLKNEFKRAAQLRGLSMNGLVAAYMRKVIREERRRHPQTFELLTEDQEVIIEAMEEGNHELQEIAEYCDMPIETARETLDDLIRRKMVVVRPKGGRIDSSRGAAKIDLFFLTSQK